MTATKTASKSPIQRKLDYLTALVDHESTSAIEKAAAERARARLVKALQDAGPKVASSYQWEPRWAGEKYVRGEFKPTTEIAALIRAEIKVARALGKHKPQPGEVSVPDPIADAPVQIKIGVRVPHYGSIIVTVKNIPTEWGYGEYGVDIYDRPCTAPSPALCKLGEALKSLANQWNYDNSDSSSDYFDTNYYLSVNDETGHGIDFIPARYRYQ